MQLTQEELDQGFTYDDVEYSMDTFYEALHYKTEEEE